MRSRIQSWLQDVLEEEVTELLGQRSGGSRWMRRRDIVTDTGNRGGYRRWPARLRARAGGTAGRDRPLLADRAVRRRTNEWLLRRGLLGGYNSYDAHGVCIDKLTRV